MGGVSYNLITSGGKENEKIASQCVGNDGRVCALRYTPGETTVSIVTLPYFGFPAGDVVSNALPFQIGSIIAVTPGIANAPDGVLITARDGSRAVYARIIAGAVLDIIETFEPENGNDLTGLVPVPSRGFLVLEGSNKSSRTTRWRGFRNSGGGWGEVSNGNLAPWLPAQTNFATLFWFKGTPLVDPTAEIVKFETLADWTRKTTQVPIPAQIELSELQPGEQGLTPFSLVAPTPPPGANLLVTSQRDDQVSITALGNDLTLQSPSLSVSPPSGNYANPVTVTALFDEAANELFYREDVPGSPWQPFEVESIGYPSSWLFYARNVNTGVAGPIVRRDYTFTGANLNAFDTDGDTVPDYVERHLGLDPGGGPDSDGDFQSDLEEILAGTLAGDHTSNTPPTGTRNPPFLGEGFELIAQAFNANGLGASPANPFDPGTEEDDFPGETLQAHDMHGNLIAEENVRELTAPPGLAGQDGAFMQIATSIEEVAWITLNSPTNFGVLDVPSPTRSGREIIKVMQRPTNPVAEVVTIPTGTDRDADALAWIAAATAAHGSHETVSAITELHPVDNALSALAEQLLYSSLKGLELEQQVLLGMPEDITDFTLFPQREGETTKVPFSPEMFEALRDAGCDFPAMFALIEEATENPDLEILANQITSLHVSESGDNPLMALPLDAFRSIIQLGAISDPAPGDPPRPNPYAGVAQSTIDSVKETFDNIQNNLEDTKRTVETWFLVIAPPTTPLHNYDYIRQGTADKVWLHDRFGERVLLEQGLGLALGTVYEITGFIDGTAPAGFTPFEPIRVESVVAPLASDTDTNANLLDDGWENVFFGELGAVGPYDPHPDTGHSYLQYQLTGADPRSGSLEGPVVTIFPINIELEWTPSSNTYDLHFDFPSEFVDQFDFVLQSSTDLAGFSGPADQGGLQSDGPDRYYFRIQTSESDLDANFFRISISLK